MINQDLRMVIDGATAMRYRKDNYRIYIGSFSRQDYRAIFLPGYMFRIITLLALERDRDGGWLVPEDLTTPKEYARRYISRTQVHLMTEISHLPDPDEFTADLAKWQILEVYVPARGMNGLRPIRLNIGERAVKATQGLEAFPDADIQRALEEFRTRRPRSIVGTPGATEDRFTAPPPPKASGQTAGKIST